MTGSTPGTIATAGAMAATLRGPRPEKRAKPLTQHGETRDDPYYWLRDDSRKDEAVLAHLRAENDHTHAALADTQVLRAALVEEMKSRIQLNDRRPPVRHGEYLYYSHISEGQQYWVHCRRRVPRPAEGAWDELDESAPEEVLLDENERQARGGPGSFYSLGTLEVSPDQSRAAWAEDTQGGEKYTLRVKELASGKELGVEVPNTAGAVVWANDNRTLFYTVKDELDRPYKVLRHVVGDSAADVEVYHEDDEAFYLHIERSRSDHMLLISSGTKITSEVRYLPADEPQGEWRVLLPRQHNVDYDVEHWHDAFLVLRRSADTPNSELWAVPLQDTTRHTVLLAHRPDVTLEHMEVSARHVVMFERAEAMTRAVVHTLPAEGGALLAGPLAGPGEAIAFEEEAHTISAGDSGEFSNEVLRVRYSSLASPASIIDVRLSDGARRVAHVAHVGGGFVRERYGTRRLWATAPDGVRVPLSLVFRKDLLKQDGSNPMLLQGYGSYQSSSDPDFVANRLCLLDRGWVFGIAHVRGGGEMGRAWYENGKLMHKTNTFDDFAAAAEYVISERYTSPDRLCISGRSAGGLLIGAAVARRPELYAGALAGVPFVDVLTTMSDPSIPLTVIEWEEWGNPVEDADAYQYIKGYSPVDNVGPGKGPYPHVLATVGLHDSRVGYWEGAKFVARLRDAAEAGSGDARLALLQVEMGAGHFSVTGRFDRLPEVALEYAFLLKCAAHVAGDRGWLAPLPPPEVE